MDELKKVIPFLGFDLIGLSEVSYTEGVIDPNPSNACNPSCTSCSAGCETCKPCCSTGGK